MEGVNKLEKAGVKGDGDRMNHREMHLCTPCAEDLKEIFKVTQLGIQKEKKQKCSQCGRQRYGQMYRVERKAGGCHEPM